MINKKANPLLSKMEAGVLDKLDPKQQHAFDKIVKAGVKVMYSEKMHPMLVNQLKTPGDPAAIAGEGVAKLLGILMNQSKGTMPMKAGIPAAAVLLCEALDMLEELGKVKVTKDTLAKAVQSLSSSLLQLMGVTPEKLSGLMAKAQAQKAQQKPAPKPASPTPPPAPPAPQGAQPLIGSPIGEKA